MRAKTFHSAIGVILLLAGIAVVTRQTTEPVSPSAPTPIAAATVTEPVVYAVPTPPSVTVGSRRPGFDLRKTTRAVLLSTIPMAPLIEVVAPTDSTPVASYEEKATSSEPGPPYPPEQPYPGKSQRGYERPQGLEIE